MTTEELMQTRYEVIADYPCNEHFAIGDIVSLTTKRAIGDSDQLYSQWITPKSGFGHQSTFPEKHFEPYPHLFRKLQWWDRRDLKDMPEYVKYVYKDEVVNCEKVIDWDANYAIFSKYDNGKPKEAARLKDPCLQPATLTDYTQYLEQLNQQK